MSLPILSFISQYAVYCHANTFFSLLNLHYRQNVMWMFPLPIRWLLVASCFRQSLPIIWCKCYNFKYNTEAFNVFILFLLFCHHCAFFSGNQSSWVFPLNSSILADSDCMDYTKPTKLCLWSFLRTFIMKQHIGFCSQAVCLWSLKSVQEYTHTK